jgi:hypothetical protein
MRTTRELIHELRIARLYDFDRCAIAEFELDLRAGTLDGALPKQPKKNGERDESLRDAA